MECRASVPQLEVATNYVNCCRVVSVFLVFIVVVL